MRLDDVVQTVQQFSRRWPAVKRSEAEAALAEHDSDSGFERLLRFALERRGVPGEVSQQRDLHFGGGRSGAVVPAHELDLLVHVESGVFVLEAKAWREMVDKEPVIVFLGKLFDFLASPRFDTSAETVSCGFIGLSGFSDAARRLMFSFGVTPFSRLGEDLSFHFLDLELRRLELMLVERSPDLAAAAASSRSLLTPYLAFENRPLTDLLRIEGDFATVDIRLLRRGAALFDESREAHELALQIYRKLTAVLTTWVSS